MARTDTAYTLLAGPIVVCFNDKGPAEVRVCRAGRAANRLWRPLGIVLTFNDVLAGRSGGTLTSTKPVILPQNLRHGISVTVLAVCLSAFAVACGKQGGSTSADAPSNAEVTELTRQVRRYSFEKRRLPQNLDELVTAGYIESLPTANFLPAGAEEFNKATI